MQESIPTGGLRVVQTSFDDAQRLFIVVGSLEHGAIPERAHVILPLSSGGNLCERICSVDSVDDPVDVMR